MILQIKPERPEDYAQTERVIARAFQTADETPPEVALVQSLRKDAAFVPALSLAAWADGQIVGHILFSKLAVGNATVLALAPLCVLPDYQNGGVGKKLITDGHRLAAKFGYRMSVVLGSPGYYRRFGYRPAREFGIVCPFEGVSDEHYMALRLLPGSLPAGTPRYADAFTLV